MEAAEFGVTEVTASEFSDHFKCLQQIDRASGESGFATEFEVWFVLCPIVPQIVGIDVMVFL